MRIPRKLVGKIVELNLAEFYVYGLCTHDLRAEGQVLRMWRDKFVDPLKNPISELVSVPFRTSIKFPLKYVLKEPEVTILGERDLTEEEATLPVFRSLGLAAENETPKGWWILDGQQETWIEALTHEMVGYPDDGIHSLGSIKELYDKDLYPHSKQALSRGPLAFDISKS